MPEEMFMDNVTLQKLNSSGWVVYIIYNIIIMFIYICVYIYMFIYIYYIHYYYCYTFYIIIYMCV